MDGRRKCDLAMHIYAHVRSAIASCGEMVFFLFLVFLYIIFSQGKRKNLFRLRKRSFVGRVISTASFGFLHLNPCPRFSKIKLHLDKPILYAH
jgi:hypothetical protein